MENRATRIFKTLLNICLLANLVAFFLPAAQRVQAYYMTVNISQFQYVLGVGGMTLPDKQSLTGSGIIWVAAFMALPFLLSLIVLVLNFIKKGNKKLVSVLVFAVLVLYIIATVTEGYLFPENTELMEYKIGYGLIICLVASILGALFEILSIALKPKEISYEKTDIPKVEEIKQEQVEAKYKFVKQETKEDQNQMQSQPQQPEQAPQQPEQPQQQQPQIRPYVQGPVKGIMYGLSGMYAGAEIPLTDGNYITLGRSAENNLIFEGEDKVSRRHCKIRFDAAKQKFIICDYSSVGTYVQGYEDCLPQNLEMEMKAGTVILLGDEGNMFRME